MQVVLRAVGDGGMQKVNGPSEQAKAVVGQLVALLPDRGSSSGERNLLCTSDVALASESENPMRA